MPRIRVPPIVASVLLQAVTLMLAAGGTWAAEAKHVIDLRFPPEGVTRITLRWDAWYGYCVLFAGDVNGDGRDDVLLRGPDRFWDSGTLLVHGRTDLPQQATLADFRGTFLRDGDCSGGGFCASWGGGGESAYAAPGDVDGDGYADFLVGSPWTACDAGEHCGVAMLVFGAPDFPAEASLDDLGSSGIRSVRFVASQAHMHAGSTVGSVGDIDADGRGDIGVYVAQWGSPEVKETSGVYVIFGPFEPSQEVRLSDVGRSIAGVVVAGVLGDHDSLGRSLAGGTDLNGDGFEDLVMGAPSTRDNSGSVCVLYGSAELPGEVHIEELGAWGTIFRSSAERGRFGFSVAAVGDVDGDGLGDILAGAPDLDTLASGGAAGRAYLIYGAEDWETEVFLDDPRLRKMELWNPSRSFGYGALGYALGGVGDWNSDGFSDFLVTGKRESEGMLDMIGHGYLIYGGSGLPGSAVAEDVGTPALPGVKITGEDSYLTFGSQVAPGGDFDGDGHSDLIVSSPFFLPQRPTERQESYLYLFRGGSAEPPLAIHGVEPDFGPLGGRRCG